MDACFLSPFAPRVAFFVRKKQHEYRDSLGIDGLAVTIDVKDRSRVLSPLGLWLPQSSCPTCERFRERDICSTAGQLCQESLCVAVAVGLMSTGEQGESLAGVAAEIPGSPQSYGFQKEER